MRLRTPLPTIGPALLLAALLASRAAADSFPLGPVPGEPHAHPIVLPDGLGGAVVAYKSNGLRVGAVRVDATGAPAGPPAFDPAPVPFALESSQPTRAWLAGGGHVLVASDRATATGPAFTRFAPDGATAAGYPLSLGMPFLHPVFVPGSDGRTLAVAKGADAASFWTVRTVVLASSGALESAQQFASTFQFFNHDAMDATSDGAGGLVAAMPYYDGLLTGSKDLCVFRLAADGSTPWGAQPRAIVNQPRDQVDPRIVPDGSGGVFMAWTDPRRASRSSDIFALRLDRDMTRPVGWLFYGQSVCDAPGVQSHPRLVRDGVGGVWVAWRDQRDDAAGDLRYSHVLGNGALAPGFTLSGALLCDAPGAQDELEIAPDGAGGFYAVWRDERNGEPDLYAHHVFASGQRSTAFAPDGEPLELAAGVQDQPSIAAIPGGRAVVAWRDARSGTTRIHAAGLVDASALDAGPPEPTGLALRVTSPSRTSVAARVTLPEAGEAGIELLDVAGRTLTRVVLAGPARDATVQLEPARTMRAGLYFVRVRQGDRTLTVRVSVLP